VRVPASTYRLQFGPAFGFEAARRLVPYLESLGITDLYASPLLRARSGSTHGYDVTDPTNLNPELGTPEEFDALSEELRRRGMGLLLDIVPNHMAMGTENPWWMDVLEHGRASAYAGFFDIDWWAPGLEGRVLVPVLGRPYGEALDRGELSLVLDDGGLFVRYFDDRFPLDPKTIGPVLDDAHTDLRERLGSQHRAVRSLRRLVRDVEEMPPRRLTGIRSVKRRARLAESIHRRLRELREREPEAGAALERSVRNCGGETDTEAARDRLDALIGEQPYVLSFWRAAAHEMDYRRFFDVTELVSLRAQDPAVFEATHGLVLELVRGGKVTGLRIDHVDGLHDPKGYLDRLQERTEGTYAVVEKILTGGESLRDDWATQGTTGYEFLGAAGALFADGKGAERLGASYARLTGEERPFGRIALEQKQRVMRLLFESEVGALSLGLQRLARADRRGRDLTQADLASALVAATAALPVYRTYVRGFPVSPVDRALIEGAVASAREEVSGEVQGALEFLARVLLLDVRPRPKSGERPGPRAREWLAFVTRWQQFTGPVMAKGVEDTAMYVYNRLLSRVEVGADPAVAALDGEHFHARMQLRARTRPRGLSATSTHDTKRSEDLRARIDVLSEIPDEWDAAVARWIERGAGLKEPGGGPDANEEWMIYQTLVGAWPLEPGDESDFADRVATFLRKALREAKVHSNWIDPDEAYEESVLGFVRRLLSDEEWRADVEPLRSKVAFHGAIGGLSQLLLKIAAPGVPDLYQGTELWRLSLVDPDSRRPVDFERRTRLLEEMDERPPEPAALMEGWADGRIKLWVTSRALRLRRDRPELFDRGSYLPVSASGTARRHVVAFARRRGKAWALAVVPRLTTAFGPGFPLGPGAWGSASLAMPKGSPRTWTDALTGEILDVARGRLPVGQVLSRLPVALLTAGPRPAGLPPAMSCSTRGDG
jgi:(1->4)-alpha-D-glucan 1-alpha-D-glucosylmutase